LGYEQWQTSTTFQNPSVGRDSHDNVFVEGVAARADQGLTVESHFVGIREMELESAHDGTKPPTRRS